MERTNFAEVTIGDQKLAFDYLEAFVDTSFGAIRCYIRFQNTYSSSSLAFKTITGSRSMVSKYQFPGEFFPGPSLEYLHLETHVNGTPGAYTMENAFTVNITKVLNGRIQGSLSGKMMCNYCPGNDLMTVSGEFEVPYRYQ